MTRLKRLGTVAGILIALMGAVALGPGLVRRDTVSFRFAKALGTGELREPIGVAYGTGRLYVSDAGNHRIVVLDTAGPVLDVWGAPELALERPMHVSLDPQGRLLVAEFLSDRITVLGSDGQVIERIGGRTGSAPGEMDAPGGVAWSAGRLFVADFYNHRVDVLGAGQPGTLGRPGRVWAGRTHYPTDVAANDTLIYVADAYNHRVQVFRPDGTFVRKWGGPLGLGGRGSLRGWFKVATGIDVSSETVYVADFENHRVQVFTDRGRYLGQVVDSLFRPTDMVEGARGELYVVDFGHARVVHFEAGTAPGEPTP